MRDVRRFIINMIQIQELLGKEYLERFKVYYPVTLFSPNWEALREHRCPICSNRLKFAKNNKLAICNGRKHKKSFVISNKKLIEILYKP
jgi:hypothetical protein